MGVLVEKSVVKVVSALGRQAHCSGRYGLRGLRFGLVLLSGLCAFNASAHNKVVVIPLAGDDKLPAGQVAANSPDDIDYYINDIGADGVSSNDTVIDHATGLEWQREDDGNVYQNKTGFFNPAQFYCAVLSLGGHSDWRLPTGQELQSIVDYGRFDPAINSSVFPNTKSERYWSMSIASALNRDFGWLVEFNLGGFLLGTRELSAYVRCVRGSSSSADYTNNGDGTVTDWGTGLTWQREDHNTERNWQAALDYCSGLPLAGGGWRLPTIKELASIVDYGWYNPVINSSVFPNTKSERYWSASSDAENIGNSSDRAWSITFFNSNSYTRAEYLYHHVRCVR